MAGTRFTYLNQTVRHFSTQIIEFQDRQAYKMFETVVLVWKSKNMKPY